MKRDFRTVYDVDYSSDYSADYDIACDGRDALGHEEIFFHRDVDADLPIIDAAEGPIKSLLPEILCLITTYLSTSEKRALGSTAHATQRQLKGVTDAILSGCGMIDLASQRAGTPSLSASAVIAGMASFRVEIRCSMLKRYAAQLGMLSHVVAIRNIEPTWAMKCRYFEKPDFESSSDQKASMRSWTSAVDSTKTALCGMTFDLPRSIARSDRYVAEMYAPLFGVISDPETHIRRVMNEAAANLPMHRWMEFLHALVPIKDVWTPIAEAIDALATEYDRSYPQPRMAVLASIVQAAMTVPHGKPMRDVCLNRFGISPQDLTARLIPRVTESVVASLLAQIATPGRTVRARLQWFIGSWADVEGTIAASLHQSFLTALAKDRLDRTTPWASLSEPVRAALRTSVLDIGPSEGDRYGLAGSEIIDFWGLYFEIKDRNALVLAIDVSARLDALPWPLQATLWRVAADAHADPHRAARGLACPMLHHLSVEQVDRLCVRALQDGMPQRAIPALQAALKWELTRACGSEAGGPKQFALSSYMAPSTHVETHLRCTPVAMMILEACTAAQRLPFVAMLSAYRELMIKCGYTWTFEALISNDIRVLLSDPTFCLTRPSPDVVQVLRHYLPVLWESLPESRLGRTAGKAAFEKRFDLPSTETARETLWRSEAQSDMRLASL